MATQAMAGDTSDVNVMVALDVRSKEHFASLCVNQVYVHLPKCIVISPEMFRSFRLIMSTRY